MSVYLVLYHDDDIDHKTTFDRMKLEEQFSMYNREISNSVIDGGSPILESKAITADGPCALTDDHISRYLMIEAEDIDEAIELSKGAPMLRRGGRAEVLEISMTSY
jgi:hypothetical protein